MAQPFDRRSLKTTGDPVPIGENVTIGQASGHFSVSSAGVLAYRAERAEERSQLAWMGRDGRVLGDAGPPGQYRDLAISPDGTQIAVAIAESQTGREDIWIRHLARGISTRLTFDRANDLWPVWSPDGSRIAFASDRTGEFRVYHKLASGVGSEDSLEHVPAGPEGPTDWSRDGRQMATQHRTTSWNLWVVPVAGDGRPQPFLQTQFGERSLVFSPDGRWVAYSSAESGRPEIYVQAFPGPGGKWQVSSNGGLRPYWRADGKELFYRAPDQAIMAAPVTAGATFESGTPVPLFESPLAEAGTPSTRWAVTADGQRFLLNVPVGGQAGARFAVVTHWTSELKRK